MIERNGDDYRAGYFAGERDHWNAAIEAAAQMIEEGQETVSQTAEETRHYVTPRKHGNIAGLAYAAAIRELKRV